MASSDNSGKRANAALYGGMPATSGPAGMAPRLLEFADELRSEGVAIGTSELLDAFGALREVPWTDSEDFREALAATLAKSQEDRHVLDVLFDRFFFRAVEREAMERGLTEGRFEGGFLRSSARTMCTTSTSFRAICASSSGACRCTISSSRSTLG